MFTFRDFEGVQLGSWRAEVKPKLALFQEQRELIFRDAVVFAQPMLGLVPEILDAIDVILLVGKQFAVIDAEVVEWSYVDGIVGCPAIGLDD